MYINGCFGFDSLPRRFRGTTFRRYSLGDSCPYSGTLVCAHHIWCRTHLPILGTLTSKDYTLSISYTSPIINTRDIFINSISILIHHASTVMHPVHASVQARPPVGRSHKTSLRHVSSGHVSSLDHEPPSTSHIGFRQLVPLGRIPQPHGTEAREAGRGRQSPRKQKV